MLEISYSRKYYKFGSLKSTASEHLPIEFRVSNSWKLPDFFNRSVVRSMRARKKWQPCFVQRTRN
ncbi:Uncharacterized protein APZ42_005851 [Daphnia magna]|uniref:Uncharacterized protein n=1 Tax=Daphnia magna TaxID=35525 RepID=A0A164G811_9CRUS|nr:Uncharacterized protein APZ42_005851 [Daphnia magna]